MEWLSRQGLITRKGRQYQSFKHGEDNREYATERTSQFGWHTDDKWWINKFSASDLMPELTAQKNDTSDTI